MSNLQVTPPYTNEIISRDSQTLTANNTTANVPIFRITGTIECRGLWGVVTTTIGANHTAAAWRLNDQTAQTFITATGGVTLSALLPGTTIVKIGLAAAACTLLSAAAGVLSEPTTLETIYFSPFVVQKKSGANTDIEYKYATTDTPTSGAIQFFLRWVPISADAAVAPQ